MGRVGSGFRASTYEADEEDGEKTSETCERENGSESIITTMNLVSIDSNNSFQFFPLLTLIGKYRKKNTQRNIISRFLAIPLRQGEFLPTSLQTSMCKDNNKSNLIFTYEMHRYKYEQ